MQKLQSEDALSAAISPYFLFPFCRYLLRYWPVSRPFCFSSPFRLPLLPLLRCLSVPSFPPCLSSVPPPMPLLQSPGRDVCADQRDYPSELPLLALRDTVVFPLTLQPLAISRPMSIESVNRALAGDRLLFLSLQTTGTTSRSPNS